MEKKNKKQTIVNEVININGYNFIMQNEEVKRIIGEDNEPTDYVDVETAFDLINNAIDMVYKNEIQNK